MSGSGIWFFITAFGFVFRHSHKYNFGCSDIYIVVHLRPTSQGQTITKCDKELTKCQWMPLMDYIAAENVHDVNKFFARQFLDMRTQGLSIQMTELELRIKQLVRKQQIYTVVKSSSDEAKL